MLYVTRVRAVRCGQRPAWAVNKRMNYIISLTSPVYYSRTGFSGDAAILPQLRRTTTEFPIALSFTETNYGCILKFQFSDRIFLRNTNIHFILVCMPSK